MARVEAARMAGHRHQAGFLLHAHECFGIGEVVGHRNLDHHMLARLQALDRLGGMQLGRGRENHGLDFGPRKAYREVGGPMRDLALFGQCLDRFFAMADDRDDFDAGNAGDRVEVLDAEGACGAGYANFHELMLRYRGRFSSTRWPTAVLEAGTW